MTDRSCSSATVDSLPYSKTPRIPRKNKFHRLDAKKMNIKKQMNLGEHVHLHLWKGTGCSSIFVLPFLSTLDLVLPKLGG